MASRPATLLIGAILGYVVAALATYALTLVLSPNTHDLAVEAAMTAAFVGGPAGSLVGLLWGWRRRHSRTTPHNVAEHDDNRP